MRGFAAHPVTPSEAAKTNAHLIIGRGVCPFGNGQATGLTAGHVHQHALCVAPFFHAMKLPDLPLTASRWLLVTAVVLSAWLYGGTREWTIAVLCWLLLAVTASFFAGLAFRRRQPRVPVWVVVPSVFVLAQGWFMTWNARSRFVEFAGVFVDVPQPLPGWPGFVDAAMTAPQMLMATGLLGAMWVACDLSANRVWRKRLWIAIAATGVSIMVLGLAQKFTGAPGIFWDPYRYTGKTFFAVFRYHANAGAYINLVLPFVVGLAVAAFHREGAERGRVFWSLAALVTAACGFINTSRAANVVSAILLLVMTAWIAAARMRGLRARRAVGGLALVVVCVGAACMLALSFGIDRSLGRWQSGGLEGLSNNPRFSTYEAIVRGALPEAGWWGFGPGTFEPVFNIHRSLAGTAVRGRWLYAHSDALQTPMDYGRAGAAAWLVLLGGALVQAVRGARRRGKRLTDAEIFSAACGFSLAGVLLHACVDFPMQVASLQIHAVIIAGLAWGGTREEK